MQLNFLHCEYAPDIKYLFDISCSARIKIPLSPNLKYMDLQLNYAKGIYIPDEENENKNLCFYNNQIKKIIFQINTHQFLKTGQIAGNKTWKGLNNLEVLDFTGNNFEIDLKNFIKSDISNLTHLIFEKNTVIIDNVTLQGILPRLQHINFFMTNLSDIPVNFFTNKSELQYINMGANNLKHLHIDFKFLVNLKELVI
jgi:Leucine-rich repeat (LRR) protein